MKVIFTKLVSAKFTLFIVIGMCGLVLNLSSFMVYIKFFTPVASSFLAFSTAVILNYFCHGKFLWRLQQLQIFSLQQFLKFYSGYSISMTINLLIVYFFQNSFDNILFVQLIGIILGSLLNFFISKFLFTGTIR